MGCLQSQYHLHHLDLTNHAILLFRSLWPLQTSQLSARLTFLHRTAYWEQHTRSPLGMACVLSYSYFLSQNMICQQSQYHLHHLDLTNHAILLFWSLWPLQTSQLSAQLTFLHRTAYWERHTQFISGDGMRAFIFLFLKPEHDLSALLSLCNFLRP
uniref:Uncharacterized protein n=1 Tax=Arundo donax TaxID=35708 RepID=A0A0A9BCU5_ARUDO